MGAADFVPASALGPALAGSGEALRPFALGAAFAFSGAMVTASSELTLTWRRPRLLPRPLLRLGSARGDGDLREDPAA